LKEAIGETLNAVDGTIKHNVVKEDRVYSSSLFDNKRNGGGGKTKLFMMTWEREKMERLWRRKKKVCGLAKLLIA